MSPDSFSAFDGEGNRYTVHVQRSYINTGTSDDPHARIEGLSAYRLTNGGAVNRLDDDTFEIVATGTVIKRAA